MAFFYLSFSNFNNNHDGADFEGNFGNQSWGCDHFERARSVKHEVAGSNSYPKLTFAFATFIP